MKKLIYVFLALLSIGVNAQTANGTETPVNSIRLRSPQTVTSTTHMATVGTDGTVGKVLSEDISMTIIPPTINYTPLTPNLKGHFQGIDNALGDIVATTAGNTTRVWFTGDATTIGAGTFYLSNATGKGTVANVSQSVTNDDNQKKYFTQDVIGQPFASNTLFPPGVYAGNLSASTTPNSAQQRFTVELYKCDNNGTPIASGVSGAPVGDLGVTVILILDSGLLTLVDGSVTNVPVSESLASQFSIATGERIRYHVSAEKVGTVASNITESVWYGTSFNSYLDVPTPITSSGVSNLSTVTGATVTVALDNLNVGKANLSGATFTGNINAPTFNGYTPENASNKATDLTTTNNTLYPTTQAVFNRETVENKQINWDGKLLINCGDSTTWQMTALGSGFDRMTNFYRLPGNEMEKITGYINFGSGGYTLSGFVNDAVTTPPVINTTSNLGIGNWDYYGHNVQIPIPQKTAIVYRESVPNQDVMWSICFGLNDLLLNASIGNLTQAQITTYIKDYLNTAVANIRKKFPKDKIILRVPNPMAARPYVPASGFPSPTEYPTFGVDKPTDVALVTKWNTALRNAYLLAANANSNTVLLDIPKKIFGTLSAEIDADKRPFMGDLVHPNANGYIAIADEIATVFTDDRIQKDFSRINEAEKKSILMPNAPYDNYANYLDNKTKYRLVLNSNLSLISSGSTFVDVPFSKDEIDSNFFGKEFYLKVGNSAIKITSYTCTVLTATTSRISSIVVSSEMQSSVGETSMYLDIDKTSDFWLKTQLSISSPRTVYYGIVLNAGSGFIDLKFYGNENRMSNNYRQGLKNGVLLISTGNQTLNLSGITFSSYTNETTIRIGYSGTFTSSIGSQFAIYFNSASIAPNQYEGISSTSLVSSAPIENGIKSFITNNIERFKGINIKMSTSTVIPSIITVDVYKHASNFRTLVGTLTVSANAVNSNTLTVSGTIGQYDTYEFEITSASTSVNDLLIFKIEPIL